MLKKTTSSKFSKPISIMKENEEEILEFSSISAAVKYLKNKNIIVDRNQIPKYLDSDKPYKGYIFTRS